MQILRVKHLENIFTGWNLIPKYHFKTLIFSAADKFTKRKGDNRFLGGDYPNTADIEGYGVLCTILGTPAMDDLAFAKPVFYQWFLSVQQHVQTHQGRF